MKNVFKSVAIRDNYFFYSLIYLLHTMSLIADCCSNECQILKILLFVWLQDWVVVAYSVLVFHLPNNLTSHGPKYDQLCSKVQRFSPVDPYKLKVSWTVLDEA